MSTRDQIMSAILPVMEEDWERWGAPFPSSVVEAVLPLIEAAWEQAAAIAERDATGVTLVDFSQLPIVQQTGSRIAFNIRAAAQQEKIS